LTYEPPLDDGGYPRLLSPERRPYRTLDGYVCALVYSDKQWDAFLAAIDRTDLPKTDPRFASFSSRGANIDYVYGELSKIFEMRTTAEWIDLLRRADIPVMPLHDLQGVLSDPHLQARQFFKLEEHPSEGTIRSMSVPVSWSETEPEPRQPAPRLGEHSVEILRQAGFDEGQIAELVAGKVVGPPAAEQRIKEQ
jgi:crotonobetainyl-CoA:carnitine CoA-transferase CaiB-like acyl-CoA transferase